jgi:monothiol glutaredoxin
MELWSKEWLDDIVAEHELVLFMKGSPEEPQCGFSSRAAQVLNSFGVNFAAINVLADQRAIPLICEWADFPTMPQVYVHGELIGGSDIVLEMYDSGELKEMYDAGRQSS